MFKKGVSGNPQGRPTGAKDKKSEKIREWLLEMVEGNRGAIAEDLAAVDPATRLNFIAKILPYVLPRLNAVELHKEEHGTGHRIISMVHERPGFPVPAREDAAERDRYYLYGKNYEVFRQMLIESGAVVFTYDTESELDAMERLAEQE